jgi:hypothetical protein
MPYPREIAIRLNNPNKYEYFRRKPVPPEDHWSKKFGEGRVDYIYGKNKETQNIEIQAVRIKVQTPNEWSKAEIDAYLQERGVTPLKVEMPTFKTISNSLFESHDFEKTSEPLHQPGIEYYTDFESSNIDSIEIDFNKNVMKVIFKSGVEYLYSALPALVMQQFKYASSKGQYFALKIKNCYPVKRLSPIEE